jgi:hypothetical protein
MSEILSILTEQICFSTEAGITKSQTTHTWHFQTNTREIVRYIPVRYTVEDIVAFSIMKLQSANRLTLLLFGHQLLVEKGRQIHAGCGGEPQCWHTFKPGTQKDCTAVRITTSEIKQ